MTMKLLSTSEGKMGKKMLPYISKASALYKMAKDNNNKRHIYYKIWRKKENTFSRWKCFYKREEKGKEYQTLPA